MRRDVLILQPQLDASGLARAAVRTWLAEEGLDELQERALLVVSELVTNAVVHARTTLELSFAAHDRLVEVGVSDRDRSSVAPVHRLAPAADNGKLTVGGWGLALVEALSDAWGVAATGNGKRVWARWSVEPASPGA